MNNSAKTEKIEEPTVMIFRRFTKKEGGAVIALMPYVISDYEGNIESYMHEGQHGGASRWLTHSTLPASEDEQDVKDLIAELTKIGYNVKVGKRINHDKYLKAYHKIHEIAEKFIKNTK